MPVAADSLERLVPDELRVEDVTGEESLTLHLERYGFAAEHAGPGRILDIACGVGYGTRLLAERLPTAREVVGVDLSPGAIEYARTRYADPRIRYVESDVMTFHAQEGFDTIVSLETTEHLPEPRAFLHRMAGLLRPGGFLIASVPTTPSTDFNPHHLHDFDERSFRKLVEDLPLTEVDALLQVQPVPFMVIARARERRLESRRKKLLGWYARNPAVLLRRIRATLRYGFCNRYLTLAWRKA